ncbi:MAG TPA: DUF3093 domain-containing protein [Actinocrinis sp.]|nr:DUF3093 domain-containing protein [Actinocrinis sp.]
MQNSDASAGGPAAYREKLSAPPSWYLLAVTFGLCFGIIFLVVNPLLALGALVVVALVGCAVVASYGSPRIEVYPDILIAGRASLPVRALGHAGALDVEAAHALQTHEADARAYMLLRSYVRTAVRVEIIDPADPTPYLYLSTRKPEELAAAVNALQH